MSTNCDVFISHSSTDSKLAFAICHYLEERSIRCWIAPRDVQGGIEYAESIILGIRNCKIMVVLFNENANNSLFVKTEVERAFNYKSIIIPFKIDDTIPSTKLELFLGSVHWLDAVKGNAEDYFDLLYQNCARSLGIAQQNEVSPPTQINTTPSKSFKKELMTGYFEVDDEDLALNDVLLSFQKRRYEFSEDGTFSNSYRIVFEVNYENLEDEETSNLNFKECFLCQDEGRWHVEDNHLILTRVNAENQPAYKQEYTENYFNIYNASALNRDEIMKIIHNSDEKIETETLGEYHEQTIFKKLHGLNKKIDAQENKDWLAKVEFKSEIAELVYNSTINSDAYYGSHIDNLDDFVEIVIDAFNCDFENAEFNGEIACFEEEGWGEFDHSILSHFDLPEDFENNLTIICRYYKEEKVWFSSNWCEVLVGAYSAGRDLDALDANLILLKNKTSVVVFSLSSWIDEHPDISCITELKMNNSILIIDSYGHSDAAENEIFHDELELNPRINEIILRLWESIQSSEGSLL
jgi:hypothetical protein